jgi:hypothetical protein
MLTYNTIYSYSTIFYTLLPYTRIVYYSLAILLYTGILGSIWKEKEEKNKKKRKRKCQTLSLQGNNIYIQTGVSEIKRSG